VEKLASDAAASCADQLGTLPLFPASQQVAHPTPGSASFGSVPIPNSIPNSSTSEGVDAVRETNAFSAEKVSSAQSSESTPSKSAPVKADTDPGNLPASAAPSTVITTADAVAAPPSVTTAAATAARPDPTTNNSPTNIPPKSDSSDRAGQAPANQPAPSDTSVPTHTSPVQAAQMVNKAAQSEMRVELNTSAFGSVEVRTTVRANDVGVLIGSEKGDLRSLLTNELPGISSSLQQQNLRLNQLSFHQGFASENNMSSGGGGSQSRSFASRAAATSTVPVETNGAESDDAAEMYMPLAASGSLSILA